MLASYNGNLETARMLLAHGADVDRRNDRGGPVSRGVYLVKLAASGRCLSRKLVLAP